VGDTFRVDAVVVANATFDGQSSTPHPGPAPTPAPGPPAPVVTQRRGVMTPFTGASMLPPPVAAVTGRSDVLAVGTAETTPEAVTAARRAATAAASSARSAAAAAASVGGAIGPGCVIGGAVTVRSSRST
jgi:hypothetical protein